MPGTYPRARRGETVENLHGRDIADPYRWLEDPDAAETKAFVDAQNTLTQSILEQCPTRDAFARQMKRMYNFPKFGTPSKRGNRYYYFHNTGLQNQVRHHPTRNPRPARPPADSPASPSHPF